MTDQQPDLFGFRAPQGDLFANAPGPNNGIGVGDPVRIRKRLHDLLAEVRAAADKSPWNDRDTHMWEGVFPNMANWLPHDEAEELRAAFRAELRRLNVAA